jgi:hypothetical protein
MTVSGAQVRADAVVMTHRILARVFACTHDLSHGPVT